MGKNEVPKSALPLLVLLAIASALGVGVAIALAGVALLLAAPAYAGEPGEGSLLLERSRGLAYADLVYSQSELPGEGRRRVVQAYRNPYDEPLAGVYVYRVPRGALIEALTFRVGVAQPRRALLTLRHGEALLERTAQIAPGETLVIELEYRSPRPILARYCSPFSAAPA